MRKAVVSAEVLVPAIIAGIASEPPWGQFVDQLRTEFGANHANLIFRGVGSSQVYFAHASSPDIECFGDLTTRYDLVSDPIPYFEMEAFRPYQVEEFLAGGAALTHPFIRDFLRPLGMEKLLICRIKSAAGLQAWLSVTRRSEGFSANEQARLVAVSHQFALALDVFGRLKAAEEDRDAYARFVHARAAGMARLDQTGNVLHVDAKAAKWLDDGRIVRREANRLCAVDPGDRHRLDAAIARLLSGRSEEEFLVLGPAENEMLEILLFGVSEPFEPAWMNAPRAIAYMCMNGQQAMPSPQRLRIKFGLTHREAALALLLARGLTLGQAAQELGVTEQTGRAYLKQVFQKAGVNRQADLVRQVFGSISAMC